MSARVKPRKSGNPRTLLEMRGTEYFLIAGMLMLKRCWTWPGLKPRLARRHFPRPEGRAFYRGAASQRPCMSIFARAQTSASAAEAAPRHARQQCDLKVAPAWQKICPWLRVAAA